MNLASIRYLLPVALIALAAGCPKSAQQSTGNTPPPQVASLGRVALVCTDLGLADGEYVRGADSVLADLADNGRIEYSPVGELPARPFMELSEADVGLPKKGDLAPGRMTLDQAEELVRQAGSCDLLILTSQLMVQPALEAIESGEITAGSILVLDDYQSGGSVLETAVPVLTVSYEVRDLAFLSGIAAAKSSTNGMFVALVSEDDLHAEEYLQALSAGAEYQSTGASVATALLPPAGEDGVIDPASFFEALKSVREGMGEYFVPNHYLVNLGRATPTIMKALAHESSAYMIGAYADYCEVSPGQIIGCIQKKPGVVLELLFEDLDSFDDLGSGFTDGIRTFGLKDGAIGFTDLTVYERYNADADDIRKVVNDAMSLILFDEIDYEY